MENDRNNNRNDQQVHLDPWHGRNRDNENRPRVERVGNHIPALAQQRYGPILNLNAAVNRETCVENAHNNERMTRSHGQAPNIEKILIAPIERS